MINLQIQKGLLMNKLISGREIASEIKFNNTGQTKKLTYLGDGSHSIVYLTEEKDVIKEFSPLIKGKATMSRKQSCNDKFTPIEGLTEFDLGIIEERRAAFDSSLTIVNDINRKYKEENDNMFIVDEEIDTSLGRCHLCRYIGGKTLQSIFEESKAQNIEFRKHFTNVLPYIVSLFDEISLYHESEIINLDIKPENLFAIKSQRDYIGIRNLDFGSTKRIVGDSGLISCIRRYALENKNLCPELLKSFIASKFFASSPGFYDNNRIERVIEKCLDPKKTDEEIISDLKLLDIIAAWKTFLFALKDPDFSLDETDMVYRVFDDIFESTPLSNSLFESYDIYFQLYEIMARCFRGKRYYRLTTSQIADRLRKILCIMNEIPENKKTEEEKKFESITKIYGKKDEFLASHGLKTINDILAFCIANNLKEHAKTKDLYWFLIFGEKHE